MNAILLAATGVVVAGGILSVVGRDARTIVAGLFLALAAAPLVADPLPDLVPFAARIAAAGLVAELVWVALRDRPDISPGWTVGWIPTSIFVAAGAAIAIGLHDPTTALGAADLGRAAGFALLVMALPGLFSESSTRIAVATVLLAAAALLIQEALTMPATPFMHLLSSLLMVATAGAATMVLELSAIRGPVAPRVAEPDEAGRPGSGLVVPVEPVALRTPIRRPSGSVTPDR